MSQQCLVDLGQPFQDGRVCRQMLAHFHKSADDVKAHPNRLGAGHDIGRLKRAVLGEGMGALGKFQLGQGCHSL